MGNKAGVSCSSDVVRSMGSSDPGSFVATTIPRTPDNSGSNRPVERSVVRPHIYRFGTLSLDARTGELTNAGTRIPLREQSLQLLLALLERPGELVTREALASRLWTADTFVDFDQGLNKAIKHLREALGDSAEHPRFIETFPRRGYRLVVSVTPDDKLAEQPEPESVPPRRRPSSRIIALRVIVACMGIPIVAILGGIRTWIAPRRQSAPQISSLAVIPLENLSRDPEQEYFADGMTDELITNLAKMSQARIVSRTSVMHYKGSRKTLQEIVQELNVDAVVEGTVERSGDRVRITAQLIQASSDSHLWAESYEQDLSGILDLQRNVATDIARQVNIIVRPVRSTGPVDPVAYVAYLKGRYNFYKYTCEGWQKSIEYFNESIQRDPGFVPAHVGLAASYIAGVGWEAFPPAEMRKGVAEAQRALELDDHLAGTHFVMAAAHTVEWRWQDAESEFRKGLALDPNDALGRQWYSNYLLTLGRFEEAINQQERARAVDPFSPIINANLAKAYYYARQFDRAITQSQATLQLEPGFHAALMFLERSYRHKGMSDQAVSTQLVAASVEDAQRIKRAYLTSGLAGVLRLEAEAHQKTGATFEAARCYAQAGEKELALGSLEDSYQRHYPGLSRLKVDPDFDPIRSDPRFQNLVRRAGLL